METIKEAWKAVEIARNDYRTKCMALWRELKRLEPTLAAELSLHLADDFAIAEWLCQVHPGMFASPAELVLSGRQDMVLSRLRRSASGIPRSPSILLG